MENKKKVDVSGLIEKGKNNGSLSHSDIMEAAEFAGYDVDQIDKLYEAIEQSGVEITNFMESDDFIDDAGAVDIFEADDIGNISFDEGAIERIAEVSVELNATSEDIGARRLHTVMEYLLEEISFNASGDYPAFTLTIDKGYVDEHLAKLTGDRNLKKYVL